MANVGIFAYVVAADVVVVVVGMEHLNYIKWSRFVFLLILLLLLLLGWST